MDTRIPAAAATLRKSPTQRRSRAMVDAIVEAAARVLGQRGWAGFTTNEVAAVAGISIGSLYQYFPSKQALAEAVRARHLEAVLAALSSGADEAARPTTLRRRVARLVDGVIAAHAVQPALHRVLLEETPLAARAAYADFEERYLGLYRDLFARRAGAPDAARDAIGAQVLAAAVEGAVHQAARRDQLGAAVFRQELETMVLGYLRAKR